MMRLLELIPVFLLTAASAMMSAQMTNAPVLIAPPNIQYPPIAKAAHVQGDVVVDFSIDSDGHTVSVQTVSGPPMLRGVVESQIKQWRFKTPLPIGTADDFEATYKFISYAGKESLDDDLDAPPYVPCCGDMIVLPAGSGQVVGEVRSRGGGQTIDVSPAGTKPAADRCSGDAERQPPATTSPDDFVELYRAECSESCGIYRIRVYRYGRVEWHGVEDVATIGERAALMRPETSDTLLKTFQAASYWAACSVEPPPPDQDVHADGFVQGDYLTVSMDGHVKSVEAGYRSFADEEGGVRYAWAVDKAADTHQWRHGDSGSEPVTNMRADLMLPKRGVTGLMRATYRFSPKNMQQTFEPLKHLLAEGADVDATDESGWTALMYAAELDAYDGHAMELLLDAHASVNRASLHGETALMIVAYHGTLDEMLMDRGADILARNASGVTTLMYLAQHGNPDELKEAIAKGADSRVQDNAGHTALDYLAAASCGKPLIPLPKQWVEAVMTEPPPCPSREERFVKSRAVLEGAMKMGAPR